MTGAPSSRRTDGGPAKPQVNRRTSELLREYIATLDQPKVSLGDLRDALGDRGFGVLLFIFAVPNLIPVNIPLLSAVLGAPLVLLAAQLTYGRHKPWFPHWLTRQSVSRENFETVVARALPYLERAERWLRPRLTVLLSWTGERLIGVGLLVLTVVLALPIPFGNWLPAFAICIVGLAIVEKDGLAVLIGVAVGAFSLVVAGAVVIGLLHAFFLLLAGLAGTG
ncbi:MAG TPA: exopolysaccharide biosynthesis protein [Methyloceanibacter sp.]|nr:exopolysaccharide biosynthesis protein [Methyloceanibacter sp.]